MTLNLEITRVVLVTGDGTDRLSIEFEGSSPFPDWMPELVPSLKMEIAPGYGEEYCLNVLKINPEILEVLVVQIRRN